MPGRTPLARLGQVPPGVWTAVIAWLAGDSVRRARNYAERLRAHAVAEAVTAERLRISRELHDLVAHSMSIITLQAGAASTPRCAPGPAASWSRTSPPGWSSRPGEDRTDPAPFVQNLF